MEPALNEQPGENELTSVLENCVQNCSDCHKICTFTVLYCLQTGGTHAEEPHIRLMLDCADICHLAVSLMLRNSQFVRQSCELCSEACRRCGESCGRFKDDEQMEACGNVCLTAAQSCQEMFSAL
jgi:hypothetical protein